MSVLRGLLGQEGEGVRKDVEDGVQALDGAGL
jgi:hypothetical protein